MDPLFILGSSNQFRSSDCLPVGDGRSGTLAGASSGDRPCLANDLRVCGCFGAAAAGGFSLAGRPIQGHCAASA